MSIEWVIKLILVHYLEKQKYTEEKLVIILDVVQSVSYLNFFV